MYRAAVSPAQTVQSRKTSKEGPLFCARSAGSEISVNPVYKRANMATEASGRARSVGLANVHTTSNVKTRIPRIDAV
jgi:hypothetical protein